MFQENLSGLCFILSGVLFTIGAVGAILRRNVIVGATLVLVFKIFVANIDDFSGG